MSAALPLHTINDFVASYPDPSFEEMLHLCLEYGLVSDYEAGLYGVRITGVNTAFELSVSEAEVLMRGLLLGYFYGQSRDDLAMATWVM